MHAGKVGPTSRDFENQNKSLLPPLPLTPLTGCDIDIRAGRAYTDGRPLLHMQSGNDIHSPMVLEVDARAATGLSSSAVRKQKPRKSHQQRAVEWSLVADKLRQQSAAARIFTPSSPPPPLHLKAELSAADAWEVGLQPKLWSDFCIGAPTPPSDEFLIPDSLEESAGQGDWFQEMDIDWFSNRDTDSD